MCGRYVFDADGNVIAYVYGVPRSRLDDLERRYNVAPTTKVPIIRQDEEGRRVDLVRWGLIPFWAKDAKISYSLINARGETLAEKPSFREAFKRRRCLVPAFYGFFEWQKVPGTKVKQPYYITLQSGEPMTFAGLWESWRSPEGEVIESCTIATTEANEMVAKLHDRMPVILAKEDWDTWLDPQSDKETLLARIRPYPADEMRAWPVSTRVNKATEDSPALIEPAP